MMEQHGVVKTISMRFVISLNLVTDSTKNDFILSH